MAAASYHSYLTYKYILCGVMWSKPRLYLMQSQIDVIMATILIALNSFINFIQPYHALPPLCILLLLLILHKLFLQLKIALLGPKRLVYTYHVILLKTPSLANVYCDIRLYHGMHVMHVSQHVYIVRKAQTILNSVLIVQESD